MSVEGYMRRSPAPFELNNFILKRNADERSRGYPRSYYTTLAIVIQEEGREGLLIIDKKISQRGGASLYPNSDLFKELSLENQRSFILNYAAVIFGVAMRCIDTALSEQVYDSRDFVAWHNEAIRGTSLPAMTVTPDTKEIHLTTEEWKDMLSYSGKDKTHAIFFEDGIKSLPTDLRLPLLQTGVLSIIRNDVLPLYRQQAGYIVK